MSLLITAIIVLSVCIPSFISIMIKIDSIQKEYRETMYSQLYVPARFTNKIRKSYYGGHNDLDYGYEYHGKFSYVWNNETRYFEVTNSFDTFNDSMQINVHPITGYTQDYLSKKENKKGRLAIFLMIVIIISVFATIAGFIEIAGL